ncbi:hypothetical protein IGI37_001746 [Enterococcus sp. AZ194]|uniref:permease prefix domain 1-containing protein n=1 Tax=Enterococcus sp. AZ194 TaxID=2774629 RepID=UPI003F24551D
MDTIKTYLDGLFLAIPETKKSQQLKTDLLANMEDRYLELIEEGKSENEAVGTTISEFGSIDELLEELHVETKGQAYQQSNEQPREEAFFAGEPIDVEDAHHYLEVRKRAALMISSGVGLIMVGLGALILCSSMYEEILGVLLMFLSIAIAVGLFITGGITFSKINKELDDRVIAQETVHFVQQEKATYQRSFVFCLVVGIALCILSVAPAIVYSLYPYIESYGASIMFFMIGLGVVLLIYGGINQGGFTKFLTDRIFIADEDELGPQAKKHRHHSPTYAFIAGIYWPIITVVFFLWGFSGIAGGWATSWLIFVLASGVFNAIRGALGVRDR